MEPEAQQASSTGKRWHDPQAGSKAASRSQMGNVCPQVRRRGQAALRLTSTPSNQPAGPARLPESARDERTPGRESGTGDNESDRNGGKGNDAGGHTNASAFIFSRRATLRP